MLVKILKFEDHLSIAGPLENTIKDYTVIDLSKNMTELIESEPNNAASLYADSIGLTEYKSYSISLNTFTAGQAFTDLYSISDEQAFNVYTVIADTTDYHHIKVESEDQLIEEHVVISKTNIADTDLTPYILKTSFQDTVISSTVDQNGLIVGSIKLPESYEQDGTVMAVQGNIDTYSYLFNSNGSDLVDPDTGDIITIPNSREFTEDEKAVLDLTKVYIIASKGSVNRYYCLYKNTVNIESETNRLQKELNDSYGYLLNDILFVKPENIDNVKLFELYKHDTTENMKTYLDLHDIPYIESMLIQSLIDEQETKNIIESRLSTFSVYNMTYKSEDYAYSLTDLQDFRPKIASMLISAFTGITDITNYLNIFVSDTQVEQLSQTLSVQAIAELKDKYIKALTFDTVTTCLNNRQLSWYISMLDVMLNSDVDYVSLDQLQQAKTALLYIKNRKTVAYTTNYMHAFLYIDNYYERT